MRIASKYGYNLIVLLDWIFLFSSGNATEIGCKKISSCHAFTTSPNNAKIINFIEWSESFFSRISDDTQVTDELLISSKSNISAKDEEEEQRTRDKSSRSNFYKVLSRPTRNICKVIKKFGGTYSNSGVDWNTITGNSISSTDHYEGAALDGDKALCLDTLYKDIINNNCLIYSFGLSDDWTFEENMANLGCKVRAFDPTVDEQPSIKANKILSKNLIFRKQGLYHKSVEKYDFGGDSQQPALTLTDTMERLGEKDKDLTILKIDIEGEEMWSIPQLLESDVLGNIKQIHIEVHMNEKKLMWGEDDEYHSFHHYRSKFIEAIRKIVSHYGFKLIFYSPNDLLERSFSNDKKYYSFFDIVLCKN